MKTTKYIAIGLLGASLLQGCSKDFLETVPTTSLSDAQIERTEEGLEILVNGINSMAYTYTFNHRWGRGQTAIGAKVDMLSDELINTLPAIHMAEYRWENHRDPNGALPYYTWDFYYTIIQHANKAIAGLEALGGTPSDKVQRLKGNAYAFRAWAYHNLVQLFAKRYVPGQTNSQLGVILRTTATITPQARATVDEVYAQIDQDITTALEALEPLSDSGRKNDIRYATAAGIAARIALTKGEWAKAEQYAETAIQRSGATLQSGSALVDGFNNLDASEWIWGYRQAADQNFYYVSFGATYAYNMDGYQGSLRFAVNRTLYDAMGEKDVRRQWWVALDRGDAIPADAFSDYFRGGSTPARANWEVTGQSIKFKAASLEDSRMDYVLMRLGELYYIQAEAEARQSKDAEALGTLKTVMLTRDAEYSFASGSGQTLIDEILRNKRIDLWLEGQNFFDLKRTNRLPDRVSAKNFDILASLKGETTKATALARNTGSNARNIPTTLDSKHWEFAIPYDELKGNPLCEINPL